MLSVATGLLLIIPVAQLLDGFMALILIGVAIGSLIPDVDASDAAVFHRNVKGLNGQMGRLVNGFVGPILPLFGYTTKYMIYKPAVHLFNLLSRKHSFSEKHRSFSHSFLGVFTLTSVTGLYLTPVLIYVPAVSMFHLLSFLSGYSFGALLHMLQDSCTRTGIAWNAPFSSKRLKGSLRTGKDNREPRFMLYVLAAQVPVILYMALHSHIGTINLSLIAVVSTSVTWLVFVSGVCEAGVE
jgi:inner membrane protein